MDVSLFDVSIFVGYAVLILGIGFFKGRGESKDTKGYFLAGGKLPWYIIGVSLVAGSVNSEQMVGTVGAAWQEGMGIVNWEVWGFPILFFMLFMFLPIFLRNTISTVPEYMEKRFGPSCRNFVTVVSIFYYILASLTVAVYGGALTLSTYFGFPSAVCNMGHSCFYRLIYDLWGTLCSSLDGPDTDPPDYLRGSHAVFLYLRQNRWFCSNGSGKSRAMAFD